MGANALLQGKALSHLTRDDTTDDIIILAFTLLGVCVVNPSLSSSHPHHHSTVTTS